MSKSAIQTDEDHAEFQRWLKSLDKQRLLNAMEFTFYDDGRSNSSHEYELLLEMLRLQSPPPTPIHPKVGGGTDGRNEAARVLRNRTKRPRLFQFFERRSISFANSPPPGAAGGRRKRNGGTPSSSAQRKRFDITATSKCVQPWGDAYNVEIPLYMQQQDEKILVYSVVDQSIGTEERGRSFMSFCPSLDQMSASDILKMLNIVSRGLFLRYPHTRKKKVPFFCAPWLDPTNRWISLPMYLASRFEVALWDSYKNKRRTEPLSRDRPWECLREELDEKKIRQAIQRSLCNVLRKDIIPNDRDNFSPKKVRHSFLFELLVPLEFHRLREQLFSKHSRQSLSVDRILKGISSSPLIELLSATDRVRLHLRQYLQAELRIQMERQLLETLAEAGPRPLESSNSTNKTTGNRNRKKKTKQKKRKNNIQAQAGHDGIGNASPAAQDSMSNISESSDEESDTSPAKAFSAEDEVKLSFPDNGTPFVERNKNIVLCLATLNDIINDVFRRVGLEVSSDESDESVVRSNQSTRPAITRPKLNIQSQKDTCKSPTKPKQSNSTECIEEKKTQTIHNTPAISPEPSQEEPFEATTPMGSFDTFPSQHWFPPGFFHRPFGLNPWDFQDGDGDGWGSTNRFPMRERSILAEFFLEQERSDASRQERITASSTAASLASSTDKNNEDTISISDKFFISLDHGGSETPASDLDIASSEISAEEFPLLDGYQQAEELVSLNTEGAKIDRGSPVKGVSAFESVGPDAPPKMDTPAELDNSPESRSRSLSPEAPATPSPRLSPILLSLDDLRDIREGVKSATLTVPCSLPSSPVLQAKRRLVASLSREDLRINSVRDDQDFTRRDKRAISRTYTGGATSYRNVAARSVKPAASKAASGDGFVKYLRDAVKAGMKPTHSCARSETGADFTEESHNSGGALSYRNAAAKSVKSVSDGSWNRNRIHSERVTLPMKEDGQADMCARSETAVEEHEDYHSWHDSRPNHDENPDNVTVGKDGSTTITSAMSHRGESEETSNLREERNSFRDMCLTLGAEVAKLKNILATQSGATMYPAIDYTQGYVQPVFGAGSFDPECMPPFFQKGQALGAMSDAGIHRAEYESQISEDDEARLPKGDIGRRMSSGNTVAESDISIEYANSSLAMQGPLGLPGPANKDSHEAMSVSGLQTRLMQDIMRFLAATEMQQRKLDKARNAAVERITKLVNTLWPRAQVKLYGSHVTGLCLPSSDLDFVIRLPAVHKNAPAVAPGVLEGRNAINETSQKLLARKLKSESWIDPRSMKLIERTVVPVIKVATKDTRARTMQLDISFDSPEHHGLEAIIMVKQIIEELPMIRPIVLVLKQFLLDRGLLTAYTGGLSSYCLFLMVARYLQEQSSWGDCGSLLMGFLDFYGNCFDPRSTGISVGRRQYFTRANYVAAQRQAAGQHMWPPVPPSPAPVVLPSPVSTGGHSEFYRRNSFNDRGSVDSLHGPAGSPPLSRPPRFQNPASSRFMMHVPQPAEHVHYEAPMDHAMPFTFDPLFVDDPLSSGNNVGRNAFRIFQVQRAFSDAHRALVASLEWDIQSAGDLHDGNDYPLLKCLLQSEDVLYEL